MEMGRAVVGASCAAQNANTFGFASYYTPEDLEKAEEFRRVLREVDAMIGTPEERAKKRAQEAKADEARCSKQKRINELYALLASLRARLSAKGGIDPGIEAQISSIQTELFWLMFGF